MSVVESRASYGLDPIRLMLAVAIHRDQDVEIAGDEMLERRDEAAEPYPRLRGCVMIEAGSRLQRQELAGAVGGAVVHDENALAVRANFDEDVRQMAFFVVHGNGNQRSHDVPFSLCELSHCNGDVKPF